MNRTYHDHESYQRDRIAELESKVETLSRMYEDANNAAKEAGNRMAAIIAAGDAAITQLEQGVEANNFAAEALNAMKRWGHYVVPVRHGGSLQWRLRTSLGKDFDLGWLFECDKNCLSVFGGCFLDPAEALIAGAGRLEQEQKERLERS